MEDTVFPRATRWQLGSIDSTQRVAVEAAEAGAPGGSVWIADEQTAGRGRLGRRWHSPPGTHLYLSFVLREPIALRDQPLLTLVTARGVQRGLAELGLAVQVKWPNDLLAPAPRGVLGGKVGGILAQLVQIQGPAPAAVIGLGLNIDPAGLPPELGDAAAALAGQRAVTRDQVCEAVLEGIAAEICALRATGFAPLLAWANENLRPLGERVAYQRGERTIQGIAVGVHRSGALRVQTDEGEIMITAGDIRLARKDRG